MKNKDSCYIYVLATIGSAGDCSPIKIGIAGNPAKRLAIIRTACPNPLRMQMFFGPMHRDYARYIEKEVHSLYQKYRLHGEWFDVTPKNAIDLISDVITVICTRDMVDELECSKALSGLGVYAARMSNDVSWCPE
jgi:hypothetical protein